jgi:acetolactate synthase-1/2/3 large subunit
MSMTENQGATTTVGAALAGGFARAGVKIAFTAPGESIPGLLEELAANHIRVVTTRHEASAAFMAEAVSQLTGRPALCIGMRGPGAADMAAGLHAARADSAPVIAIVDGAHRDVRGREALRDLDIVRVLEPIVKWAAELKEVAEAVPLIERALATATGGRPGPVLLAIPADLLDGRVTVGGNGRPPVPHAAHQVEPDPVLVRKVLHLLADSRRPLILAGAGVLRARSSDALVRFAETMRVPVVSSWRRGDVFPNDNPLYLGMAGPGSPSSVKGRLEEADALLVLGSRLGEATTFGNRIPGPVTRWAQVDLEPFGAASDNRPEIVMAADASAFLRVAHRVLARAAFDAVSLDARTAANAADRTAYEAGSIVDAEAWDGPGVHPGRVIATLARVLPHEAILTTDSGDFGTWAARGYRFHRPGTFLGSTAGPMGYGLPAAIGAALARPGRLGVALAGAGGFAMTMGDLETAVRERAHVLALVLDSGGDSPTSLQQLERGGVPGPGTSLGPVDFAAVAAACGAVGISVTSDDEFEPALRQAMEAGRPALLHLIADAHWTAPDGLPASDSERTVPAPVVDPITEAVEVDALVEAAVEALVEAEAEVEAAVDAEAEVDAAVDAEVEAEVDAEVAYAPEPGDGEDAADLPPSAAVPELGVDAGADADSDAELDAGAGQTATGLERATEPDVSPPEERA